MKKPHQTEKQTKKSQKLPQTLTKKTKVSTAPIKERTKPIVRSRIINKTKKNTKPTQQIVASQSTSVQYSTQVMNQERDPFEISIIAFLKKFNLRANNISYYIRALTHNSYANENNLNYNYQRLELLGDAVLELAVTDFLFFQFYDYEEGQITEIRSHLIRTSTLQIITQQIGLLNLARLGKGEQERVKNTQTKLYADIFESFLGALYIDLQWDAVQKFLKQTIFKLAEQNNWLTVQKDSKTILQEMIAQKHNKHAYELIEYKLQHIQKVKTNDITSIKFHVQVIIDGQVFGTASGSTKQEAEQNAAQICLDKMSTTFS